MRSNSVRMTIIALFCLYGLLVPAFRGEAFIERKYTVEQIIQECTNILFGSVTEVNRKRMTAKVKVDNNLKGSSRFKEIKINLAVGDGNFPQQLVKQFEVGLPIIVFYKKAEGRLMSLGHINGTWFQVFAQDRSDKNRVWWNLTHIEIHMHRTYDGPTPKFQKHLLDVMIGKTQKAHTQALAQAPRGATRVLVLTDKRYDIEFRMLSKFGQVAEQKVVYQKTTDRDLPNLKRADILWLGQGQLCESKYFLTREQENRIKAFVKNGGVVVVSGQDSDPERSCDTGWLPERLEGVERKHRQDFQPTRKAGTLFSTPNKVKSGRMSIDDTWTGWNDKYTILATTNGGKDIAVAMLKHGRGMYLITGLQNETSDNISTNRRVMENLIHFAIEQLKR